ncbi:GLPGLI family protein [Flavihumibacter petaseus]|uniref:GLPGLI family protein n=1 Tax=Flavihumibacter petaseus NBRC 106054 TaxID=1220578 RepID=A0A0E9MV81_9BACT|nr:GLPGLI family protein [Flavihumibacter petaseus]GAO41035.1 hypothetical protein FPE01S_01_00470 [Flavihumibacter petaseus NBRC 106054]
MKRILILGVFALAAGSAFCQQREARVYYTRTTLMQLQLDGEGPVERKRTDNFVLDFAGGKMIWQKADDELPDETVSGGGGLVIRTIGGTDDIIYCDFNAGKKVEQREFFDRKFLVSDTLAKGKWILSDSSRTILGHSCRKATGQRISQRSMMTMDNGKMSRREFSDTTEVAAWFAIDIPVPAGPEMQGQLPGLIMILEGNHGRTRYEVTAIEAKADIAAIREPAKGKKVSPSEFIQERNKMMEEMQKNNQGNGNMRIRIN